ncbi:hypothetical protein [Salibacter halophilus]|uniref:Uncharacterized protein n=1 Tax=Salibacter halophilus TaxID=1803916 RepID=A0A6N6MB21_9FLAO|nr:hypothetical protein [Salibacter halophilus]KAB1066046.1 hypothetical protein F3059_00840 [Salibacter halophilus]
MRITLLLFFLFEASQFFGQNPTELAAKIAHYKSKQVEAQSQSGTVTYNDSLIQSVKEFLNTEDSYEVNIESKFMGDLRSPDDEFRLITWNIPERQGSFTYFAFIQFEDDRPWIQLNDGSDQYESRPLYKTMNAENWYGALYYEIIPFKSSGKEYYALLGWDGNSKMSNKKVIEIAHFNKKGKPTFGAQVFGDDKLKNRVVFEFKKDATLSLRYHEDDERIVFNHLEPLNPEMEGIYSFYVPNLNFDAYELKKGKWEFVENVEVIMKTKSIFHDPRGRKEPVKKPGNPK